jgi:hypothetical protein
MDLIEYVVRLKSFDDLESFYQDIETDGGNLTIPDRSVGVRNKRPNNRSTNYMLTNEEADIVRQDLRVEYVVIQDNNIQVSLTEEPMNFAARTSGYSHTYDQWGLYRHTLYSLAPGDFDVYNNNVDVEIELPYTGRNVDIVILDDIAHDPTHSEFLDDDGNSRVVYYNWYKHAVTVQGINPPGSYIHDPVNNSGYHNIHVAGTAAGKTQGWARNANIYFLSLNFGGYHNSSTVHADYAFDYIREFHNAKPINPLTGRKNPTIVNNSWGSYTDDYPTLGEITQINESGNVHYPPLGEYTRAGVYGIFRDGNSYPSYNHFLSDPENITHDFARQKSTLGYTTYWAPTDVAHTPVSDYSNLTQLTQTDLVLSSAYSNTKEEYGSWTIPIPWAWTLFNFSQSEIKISTNGVIMFYGSFDAAYSFSKQSPMADCIVLGATSIDTHDEASLINPKPYELWYGTEGVAPNREFRIVMKYANDVLATLPVTPDSLSEFRMYENDVDKITLKYDQNNHYLLDGQGFSIGDLYSFSYAHGKRQSAANTTIKSAVEDAIDAGIIIIAAAGNDDNIQHNDIRNNNHAKVVDPTDGSYDLYYNTVGNPGHGYLGTDQQVIRVGALSLYTSANEPNEQRAIFTNYGTAIDIYAAGEKIISSMPYHWFGVDADTCQRPNGSKYWPISGTSMASPQVTGLIACILEKYPDMNQRQVRELLSKVTSDIDPLNDGDNTWATESYNLYDGINRVLYYPDFRKEDTATYPEVTNKGRPNVGAVYPRSKIKNRKTP